MESTNVVAIPGPGFEERRAKLADLRRAVHRALVGQDAFLDRLLIGLLARGHVLVEGVPGLAKTLAIRAVAGAVDASFSRIQFTPDLLPADLTGTLVFHPATGVFTPRLGPLFANIVLADEINRTTPKTQSALLEAMNESQVTIENVTYPLPRPFMVLATQNPIEHHGTYPLPESQLDRFLMRIEVGYPDPAAEKEILKRFSNGHRNHTGGAVLDPNEVLFLQDESRKIHIDDAVVDYMIRIVNRTREHPEIELGISPRGTAALFRATQSLAMIEGRSFVLPDDIKRLAPSVFEHRLVLLRSGARARADAKTVLSEIIDQTPVPA